MSVHPNRRSRQSEFFDSAVLSHNTEPLEVLMAPKLEPGTGVMIQHLRID